MHNTYLTFEFVHFSSRYPGDDESCLVSGILVISLMYELKISNWNHTSCINSKIHQTSIPVGTIDSVRPGDSSMFTAERGDPIERGCPCSLTTGATLSIRLNRLNNKRDLCNAKSSTSPQAATQELYEGGLPVPLSFHALLCRVSRRSC
jgi:hypothetical protein